MSGKHWSTGFLLPVLFLMVGCERPLVPAAYTNASNVAALEKALSEGAGEGSAEAAPEEVAMPTGWANLKGSFTLDGTPPSRTPLAITKEQDICMPGGKPVLSEEMVVDPSTKGIRDVLIYLSTETGGKPEWEHPSYAESATATVDFDQKQCIFLSHVFAMRSSQTLRILNSDPTGHNTSIPGKDNMKSANPTVPAGSSVMYNPGGEANTPASVSCSIHPWMSSNLIARNNPYFAVSNPDGTFEIKNIPAGVKLEFRIWQEKIGFVGSMTVNGSAVKDKKGRVELTAANEQTVDWNVVIPAP